VETVYIVFVAIVFIACMASAVFGFGTALIVIGSHVLPIKEIIVLTTVLFIASTLTKSIVYGKHIDWKQTSIMSLESLLLLTLVRAISTRFLLSFSND